MAKKRTNIDKAENISFENLSTVKFEDSPSFEENPILTPLSEETKHEGGSLSGTSAEINPSFLDDADENTTTKDTISKEINEFDLSQAPPPPPVDPESYSEDSIHFLDEDDEIAGSSQSNKSGGSDFIDSAGANEIAELIVELEDNFIFEFMRNRTRINESKLHKKFILLNVEPDDKAFALNSVKEFNKEVDAGMQMKPALKKQLKKAWASVIEKHSEVSEKITPETRLIMVHGMIGFQLYMAGKRIRPVGDEILKSIENHFEEKYQKEDI